MDIVVTKLAFKPLSIQQFRNQLLADPSQALDVNGTTKTRGLIIDDVGSGTIILKDSDGVGCSAITANDGVLSAAIIPCP